MPQLYPEFHPEKHIIAHSRWFSSKGVNFDVKSEEYVVRYNSGAIMGFKIAESEGKSPSQHIYLHIRSI